MAKMRERIAGIPEIHVTVRRSNGEVRSGISAWFLVDGSHEIIIRARDIPSGIDDGDIIERSVPHGYDRFIVRDPGYTGEFVLGPMDGFPEHYAIRADRISNSTGKPDASEVEGDPTEPDAVLLLGILVTRNLGWVSNSDLLQMSGIEDGDALNDALDLLDSWDAVETNWMGGATAQPKYGMVRLKGRGRSIYRERARAAAPTAPETKVAVPRPLSVFLCHGKEDKLKVRDLYEKLLQAGHDPWLDAVNLLAGQEWELEIKKAVKAADVVVVCLSANWIDRSGVVQKEIRLALDAAEEKPEGDIYIIPLLFEKCDVPQRLGKWQWVDLTDPQGMDRLLRSLHFRARK